MTRTSVTRTLSPLALGYSILAGPILWFVHFVAVYSLAEFGCRANFNNLLFITPSTIRIVVIVLTLPTLLAVGYGGVVAYRAWETVNRDEPAETSSQSTWRFLLILGMLFSAMFLLSILFTVAPAFVLNVCEQGI